MEQKTNRVLRFGVFRLNQTERQLTKNGEPVSLPPKVFDLLVVLAENPGRLLEKAFLLQTVWPDTFVEEANLSVHISTLRRALGDRSAPGEFIETVPKKGYRFVASIEEVNCQPVTPPLPTLPEARRERSSKTWRWIALAASVFCGLVVWMIWPATKPLPRVRSLAVLPFTALNGDATEDYLGLGMADALITRLGGVKQLTVRPTSSVLHYANFQGPLATLGRELGVDAVLEGRLQKSDGTVRVTVQLLRPEDGASLWADHFEGAFTNIFSVQDSIAERVAAALQMKLANPELQQIAKRETTDSVAYQYYLQGSYLAMRRLNESTQQSIRFFEQAVGKDPEYALAWSGLAAQYVTRSSFGWGDELSGKAKSAALKALALDANLADAHIALGQVLMRADLDWAGAAKAFDRAIALDRNNASAHASRSLLLTAHAQHPDAIREMELACNLDPGNASLRSDLAWTYSLARNFDKALEQAGKAVRMDARSFTAHREMNKAYLGLKQYSKALEAIRTMSDIAGGENRRIAAETAQIYALAGRKDDARAKLAEVQSDKWHDPPPLYLVAVAQANMGDFDLAFAGLNAALDKRLSRALWLKSDPELDSIRGDARFATLQKRLGVAN